MQLSFGAGAVWGERTDVVGSGIGPRQFGVLQDIQIDFDWTDKELYGQLQFPVAIARGQGKITGKAKFAQILGLLYSDIFFGLTPGTGQFAVAQLEAANCAGGDAIYGDSGQTRQATTMISGSSTPVAANVSTGQPRPSAAGQYSVNFSTGILYFLVR